MYNNELNTFLLVAKNGSFSGAAKEMYVSKNAVMQQINLLESHLDLTLFNRTTHGVTLTNAGRVFVEEAQKILELSEQIDQNLARYKNTIFVGSGFLNPPILIKKIWHQFLKINPKSRIDFIEIADYENLSRNIDLFEGCYAEKPFLRQGFSFCKCTTSKLVAIMPPSDPLVKRNELRISDLEERQVVIPDDSAYRSMHEIEKFLQDKISNIKLEKYNSLTTAVVNNAQIRDAILLVPDYLGTLANPNLVKKVDWDLKIDYGLYYRPDSSELCQKLIETIKREFNNINFRFRKFE